MACPLTVVLCRVFTSGSITATRMPSWHDPARVPLMRTPGKMTSLTQVRDREWEELQFGATVMSGLLCPQVSTHPSWCPWCCEQLRAGSIFSSSRCSDSHWAVVLSGTWLFQLLEASHTPWLLILLLPDGLAQFAQVLAHYPCDSVPICPGWFL